MRAKYFYCICLCVLLTFIILSVSHGSTNGWAFKTSFSGSISSTTLSCTVTKYDVQIFSGATKTTKRLFKVIGCVLKDENGNTISFSSTGTTHDGNKSISDTGNKPQIYNYTTTNVTKVTLVNSKYLNYEFNDNKEIIVSIDEDSFATWKKNEPEGFYLTYVEVLLECSDSSTRSVSFESRISTFTNAYEPEFLDPDEPGGYEVTLPMPLAAGYTIAGNCGKAITVIDYDIDWISYRSNLVPTTEGETMGIELAFIQNKNNNKTFTISLRTTRMVNLEEPLIFKMIATDVPPSNKPSEESKSSSVTIKITPNITASTPPSPLFSEPLYTAQVDAGSDIITSISLSFIEGYNKDETEINFKHGAGEDISTYFTCTKHDDHVTIDQTISFPEEVLLANHGVFIVEATRSEAEQSGKTVIHVSLPGSEVTTPTSTTSTTSTTAEPSTCAPCPTTTTEEPSTCPPPMECPTTPTQEPCICPTPEECPTTITAETCTCPTFAECPTTSTAEPCICPTPEECPKPTPETCPTTETTTVTQPSENSTETTGTTCEPCVCSTITSTESSSAETTTNTSSCPVECTTTVSSQTTTCPTISTQCPIFTTGPPESPSVNFNDKIMIVPIARNYKGNIKQLITEISNAPEDTPLTYSIVEEKMKDVFEINEKGVLSILIGFEEDKDVTIRATITVDDQNYTDEAKVHVTILLSDVCENGTQWNTPLQIFDIEEESSEKVLLQCIKFFCSITSIFPDSARGFFSEGDKIIFKGGIDREDNGLFPDLSYTQIVLHIDALDDKPEEIKHGRLRSPIDKIGNITKDDNLRIRLVVNIIDIDDNPVTYNNYGSSVTVGYPGPDIVEKLLPPYLLQVTAKDKDLGDNAVFKYKLDTSSAFSIEEDTGIIYPNSGFYEEDETTFRVHTEDQYGKRNNSLVVNVKMLNEDDVFVIKSKGSRLENKEDILSNIAKNSKYTIKSLYAASVVGEIDSEGESRHRLKKRIMEKDSSTYLHLVVYGLDETNETVSSKDVINDLKNNNNNAAIQIDEWNSNSSNDDEDGSMAVIIALAVVALILAVALSAFMVLYIKLRKNNYNNLNSDSNSTTILMENEQLTATEEMKVPLEEVKINNTESNLYETVEEQSSAVSPVSAETKDPDSAPENKAWTVLGDFDSSATDEFKSELSDDDTIIDDEKGDNTRKKSVVTFNENVERIEIARL